MLNFEEIHVVAVTKNGESEEMISCFAKISMSLKAEPRECNRKSRTYNDHEVVPFVSTFSFD